MTTDWYSGYEAGRADAFREAAEAHSRSGEYDQEFLIRTIATLEGMLSEGDCDPCPSVRSSVRFPHTA